MSDLLDVDNNELDAFTSERIIDAAAQGETVEGFEGLSELLGAFHEPPSEDEMASSLPAAAVVRPSSTTAVGRVSRRGVVAASVAVLGMASVAAAAAGTLNVAGGDDPVSAEADDDTLLNFGYDEEFQLFVWNTTPTDGETDCTLEQASDNPAYEAEFGLTPDEIAVVGLAVEGLEVTFPTRDLEGDPIPYSSVDSECTLGAAEVAGPNGQINHGMFMKLFNSMFEGTGHGCVNRHLAQSDLGKGDQQVKVDDVDPEFESVATGAIGEITFSSILADCEHSNGNGNGNSNGGNGNGNSNSNGGNGNGGNGGNGNGNSNSNGGNGNGGNGNGGNGNGGNGNGNSNGRGNNKG